MKFAIYAQDAKPHQVDAAKAFESGIKKAGHDAIVAAHGFHEDADIVVGWGLRSEQLALGRPWICLEAGYINGTRGSYKENRLRFISANFGGTGNQCAKFYGMPSDRAEKHSLELSPWRVNKGGDVLFFGQVPGDASVAHFDYHMSLSAHLKLAQCRYGDAVKFRAHPLSNITFEFVRNDYLSLEASLRDAFCTVTFNSTATVEAVLAGVPSVTLDARSVAFPVTTHRIGQVEFKEREQWLYNLAYMQWTLDELASGEAWRHLSLVHSEIYG